MRKWNVGRRIERTLLANNLCAHARWKVYELLEWTTTLIVTTIYMLLGLISQMTNRKLWGYQFIILF
jgi:hypothetical protein